MHYMVQLIFMSYILLNCFNFYLRAIAYVIYFFLLHDKIIALVIEIYKTKHLF